ncbi:hypothetical protein [Halosimplex halophilum]|uniref:hypothetical protein n=1 Tax=Halosimplex halophilum TaxID=2559572 RepID=UPI00107F20D0|nr:hypothetical protein [Halosimplex halophilum]
MVYTYNLNASVATTTGVDIGIGGTPVFVQNEDAVLAFTVHNTPDHETTVDISGYTFEWVLTDSSGGTTATKDNDGGGGISISDASGGVVEVTLDSADTSGVDPGTVQHQLDITDDGSGNQSTVAIGDFQITEDLSA